MKSRRAGDDRAASRVSSRLRDSARVAGWSLGLTALVSALGALLAQHRAGSLAVQTFATDWGAGQLGVAWSDPEAPIPSSRAVALRLARGALFALGAAVLVLTFAVLTHAATLSHPTIAVSDILVGLAIAGFLAVRDELLLRGLPLRVFGHTLPPFPRLLACGAIAAAAHVGQLPDARVASFVTTTSGAASLAIAACTGVCFGAAWLVERGAFIAFGAHLAWGFATTTAISGGLLDVRFAGTTWGGLTQGFDASGAVAVALAGVTVAVLFLARDAWVLPPNPERASIRR